MNIRLLLQQLRTLVSCIVDKQSTNNVIKLNIFTQEVFFLLDTL